LFIQLAKMYFDLDGVLVDFDAAYRTLTGVTCGRDAILTDEEKDHKWSLLNPHPDFFLNLPWIPGARTMVAYAMYAPYTVGILSAATRRIVQSPKQKQDWCTREVPFIAPVNVTIVNRKRDKVKYVGPGNILVDDHRINIERWQEAGGIGILFENPVQTMMDLQAIAKAPEPSYKRMLNIVKRECQA
jgi:5'(3')-deoxyribonucleotidase